MTNPLGTKLIARPTLRPYRRLQHWYATTHHYYWLPCPICGTEYGGHESRYADKFGLPTTIPDPTHNGLGSIICPECTIAGYGYAQWPTRRMGGWTTAEIIPTLTAIARTNIINIR